MAHYIQQSNINCPTGYAELVVRAMWHLCRVYGIIARVRLVWLCTNENGDAYIRTARTRYGRQRS